MRRRWLRADASVTLLWAALAACGKASSGEVQTVVSSQAAAVASAPDTGGSAPAVRPPSYPSRVYVDVSTGVRGFAAPSLKTPTLAVLHQRIVDAVGEAGVEPPKQPCAVGIVPKCVEWSKPDDGGPPWCTRWRKDPVVCGDKVDVGKSDTYAAKGARLEAILQAHPPPAQQDPDHPAQLDWLDDVGLSVLVSGGLDGGPLPSAASEQSTDSACKGGPNPSCVSRALAERVKAGYGVWLVAALLPFDGDVFSDVPVDARYSQPLQDHLKKLKLVQPGETTKYAGVDFTSGKQGATTEFDGNNIKSVFKYRGVRPLLIWAFTKDAAKGRAFARSLADKLRAEPTLRPGTMRPTDVVQSAEISPLALSTFRVASLEFAPKGPGGQGDFDPVAQSEFHFKDATAEAQGWRANVTCGANGKAWLLAKYEEVKVAETLPPYIKQAATFDSATGPHGAALPGNVIQTKAMDGQPGFKIAVNCSPFAASKDPHGIELTLRGSVDVDETAAAVAWWADLSAPNTYEMPERVFGLKELLLPLFRQKATRDASASYVHIVLTRTE